MIGTRERVLPESSRNIWFQFFDLQIRFNHNALNLNISHNHVRIYTSVRKSWRDERPMESIEILDDVSFRLILKDWGSTWQCLPFCWSWYRVGAGEWKRGGNRIRGHWFWDWGLRHLLRTSTKKISSRACLLFFLTKKNSF